MNQNLYNLGWRTNMEDEHIFRFNIEKYPHINIFAIFDGHGG